MKLIEIANERDAIARVLANSRVPSSFRCEGVIRRMRSRRISAASGDVSE